MNRTAHVRPRLLYVDDRPISLTERALARTDLDLILLRFEAAGPLPDAHISKTADVPAFTVRVGAETGDEISRFRRWADGAGMWPTNFLNPSEPRQAESHRFASALGLPALSRQQVNWVRDKPMMKQRLIELGLPVARHRVIGSFEELRTFGEQVGWPIILKPIDSFACINTYLLDSLQHAEQQWRDLHSDVWLIEAFVGDREWECCALVRQGKVLDAYVSYMPASPLAATEGAMNANISVGGVPNDFPLDVKTLVQRIVDGMELSDGYLHMEMFIGERGELTVSEVGFRIAGCEIPVNHGLARGFNMHDAIIDLSIGREPSLSYTQNRCVGDLLLPLPSGRVEYITPLADLLAMEGVIAGRLRVQTGDAPDPRRASNTSAGFVHIQGETIEQVEYRMNSVLRQFKIRTSMSGGSL